jgi:O-6-methylguanine DNA methyltransferase
MFSKEGSGRTVFTTSMGGCALAWTPRGVDLFMLPHNQAAVLADVQALADHRPFVKRPQGAVAALIRRAKAHLDGKPDPLLDIPLDLRALPPFSRRVYRALRKVPPGRVVTYGQLAKLAGSPGAARAVGTAMATNPVPLLVPCHRVLPAGGGLGGFSSPGGPNLKAWLLHREGYVFSAEHQAGLDFLAKVDRRMRTVIHKSGPYLPAFGKKEDPYDVLVLSIIHQQLSMKAASTIAGRVRRLTDGDDFPSPPEMLALPEQTMRDAGLSFQKISYLKDLADHVLTGKLNLKALWRMNDDAATEALCRIRGIGVWTAQMVLIFNLGRLDVWPVDDLGLRNAVGRFERMPVAPTIKEMAALGEKWRPYRSIASWYLWRTVDGGGV